jgi:spore germination cell wall hydrolase CwlJ-like protein
VIALLSNKMTGYFLLAWMGCSNLVLPLGLLISRQPAHSLFPTMQPAQPRQSQSRPEPAEKSLTVNKHQPDPDTVKRATTALPARVPTVKPVWRQTQPAKTVRATQRSDYQFQMLARIISAEAKGEPLSGQVAVGAVILNRVASSRFPKTIAANVLKRGQFEPVTNGAIWNEPTISAYRAAGLALKGWDPTGGALYFFNPAKSSSRWIWSRQIVKRIGDHVFAV